MRAVSLFATLLLIISACTTPEKPGGIAPGAPGAASFWSYAGKNGIGTSYVSNSSRETNDSSVSRVWFSLTKGIITETAFGMIHEAQIKDIRLAVIGDDFVDYEDTDTNHAIEYLYKDDQGRPLSLAYKLTNTDKQGKYTIVKHVFTDPASQTLVCTVQFTSSEEDLTPVLLVNPHMNNTGSLDSAFSDPAGLHASEGDKVFMTLSSSIPFAKTCVGYKGTSDGYSQLKESGDLTHTYTSTGEPGNVILSGEWPASQSLTTTLVVGFGHTLIEANGAVNKTINKGAEEVLKDYNGQGKAVGWEDYIASLDNLPSLYSSTGDSGKLLNTSAMVLKALEDKENSGALIASLSIPWGDSVSAEKSATGYRAVWPRDFYQSAMALLALGDENSAMQAFKYLKTIQVTDSTPGNKGATGWFLQKTVVNGQLEWFSVQMDQTAMPVMLSWKLWKNGALSEDSLSYWYNELLKPAATFLRDGGKINLDWNQVEIDPPFSQQERWEEQAGYSPSTMAAIVTGLFCAADLAADLGNKEESDSYRKAAADYNRMIEKAAFTTSGEFGDGEYYIRISHNQDPNDHEALTDNNGKPGMAEDKILDAGFLELVRYGLREPDDPRIMKSIRVLDDTTLSENLQVKYYFDGGNSNDYDSGDSNDFEGWRRYGNDGYGEDITDGSNYGRMGSGQRGRVWPIFTGERGHYQLALLAENGLSDDEKELLINRYVKAMEYFANDGLMLPEQVWDGVGKNEAHHYTKGEGTSSATPLAWAHAEYIKLVKSIHDGKVWDHYSVTD